MCDKYRREKIKGFEEYEVDTNGVIYSKSGKPLKYSINHNGYCIVNLMKNGKRVGKTVHSLVANQFINKPKDKRKNQINHIDGIKTNNNVNNLEWVTSKENNGHKINVLGKNNIGKNNYNSRRVIAKDNNGSELIFDSLADAGRFFNSSRSVIWKALNGYLKTLYGYVWTYSS